MAFTESLAPFLADFGVPVVIGATTTRGLEDYADALAVGDDGRAEVIGRVRTVLLKTSDVAAAGLTVGSTLTVNSVTRTARDVRAVGDGAFTEVALR